MQELDKRAMGQRIRQIRLEAGFRQWELAKLLGTTQSAVHKYEHGVVPEPKRLIELAHIGGTSVEWVLTGTHWENGSSDQRRLDPELLRTAAALRELEERGTLDEALRILRDAMNALERLDDDGGGTAARSLRDHAPDALAVLEAAARIQRAVLRRVARDTGRRLARSGEDGRNP